MEKITCPHCKKEIDYSAVVTEFARAGGRANAQKNLELLRKNAKLAAQARWSKKKATS